MSKMRERVSRMCENAYLSIKNPKASRALKQALDPSHRLLASLRRQLSASEAGPPLDQILDPHLGRQSVLMNFHVFLNSATFVRYENKIRPPHTQDLTVKCSLFLSSLTDLLVLTQYRFGLSISQAPPYMNNLPSGAL